ncbi:hypothetical protein ZIOFF_053358 [Zingiber officinale]|uniref:60S acidic ribosomal protein P1 n=1 Tax=Zingiber officinale TaxID=94328 RepID=A0A8J5KIF6_ZINOF|nr:hypothetical protein ZIOFF_053358 [Zingiber officinale]
MKDADSLELPRRGSISALEKLTLYHCETLILATIKSPILPGRRLHLSLSAAELLLRFLNPQFSKFLVPAMSVSEIACTYAALILYDDGIPITSEKISTLVKAANVTIESYWAALFAKLLEKRSVEDLILSVGSGLTFSVVSFLLFRVREKKKIEFWTIFLDAVAGGGGAPVAVSAAPASGGAAPAAAAPAAEEKKEEPKEESDDDMGFSLFD